MIITYFVVVLVGVRHCFDRNLEYLNPQALHKLQKKKNILK